MDVPAEVYDGDCALGPRDVRKPWSASKPYTERQIYCLRQLYASEQRAEMRWDCRERMEQKSVWEAKAAEVLAGQGPRRIVREALEALLADAAEVPTFPSSAG